MRSFFTRVLCSRGNSLRSIVDTDEGATTLKLVTDRIDCEMAVRDPVPLVKRTRGYLAKWQNWRARNQKIELEVDNRELANC